MGSEVVTGFVDGGKRVVVFGLVLATGMELLESDHENGVERVLAQVVDEVSLCWVLEKALVEMILTSKPRLSLLVLAVFVWLACAEAAYGHVRPRVAVFARVADWCSALQLLAST